MPNNPLYVDIHGPGGPARPRFPSNTAMRLAYPELGTPQPRPKPGTAQKIRTTLLSLPPLRAGPNHTALRGRSGMNMD
eukprot:GDKH01017437.1.p5 GENE.GDKH01017437.1~~GDKH01017437.1.p5  ORF type:complete len:78 (-),score=6.64 GDKH01017437.1:849-1082(-)